jgi:hypothetical protein
MRNIEPNIYNEILNMSLDTLKDLLPYWEFITFPMVHSLASSQWNNTASQTYL